RPPQPPPRPLRARECARPAPRASPAAATWNPVTRAPDKPDRESPPQPPRIQTASRGPPRPHPPPSEPQSPRLSFHNAVCSAVSSPIAAWPRKERAFVRTGTSSQANRRKRVVHHLRREHAFPQVGFPVLVTPTQMARSGHASANRQSHLVTTPRITGVHCPTGHVLV